MIQIGTRPKESEGPAGLLLACHQRIRSFTELAARIASEEPAPDDEVAEAARRVHRYHAVALPLHQADEELSLAPRLEGAVPRELAAMKREHVELDEVLAGLLPLWERVAAEPRLRRELSSEMAREVGRMQRLWTRHLAAEEELIFPALKILAAAELEQIAGEMRARRSTP
jgi:hemerythrin-like domain-containing protein